MWNKICGGAILMVIHFCGVLWHTMRCVTHLKPTGKPAGMPLELPALPHLKKFKPQIYVG